MQQRQPRLGDILDDYCPRERRLTNHVVVAMVGDAVKQTRCTTCEADHEYKHATVPRQRKKPEQSALYSQVLASVAPKRVVPAAAASAAEPVDAETAGLDIIDPVIPVPVPPPVPAGLVNSTAAFEALFEGAEDVDGNREEPTHEGPAHRRLIRAQLPRHEGQVAVTRQAPDFTIRQPNPGRPKRFGARPGRGAAQAHGNRSGHGFGAANGNSNNRGGQQQRQGGRPQGGARPGGHRPGGRNRSK